MNDVYPTIVVDRNIGILVSSIDFDYPTLVAYMRERGFSDDQIIETSIYVDSKVMTSQDNHSKISYSTLGSYQKINDQSLITLYPTDRLKMAYICQAMDIEYRGVEPHFGLSDDFSRTLVHELEHQHIDIIEGGMKREHAMHMLGRIGVRVATAAGNALAISNMLSLWFMERPEQYTNSVLVAAVFGLRAAARALKEDIDDFDYYYTAPDEVRCREAEEHTPDNLVQFRLKSTVT